MSELVTLRSTEGLQVVVPGTDATPTDEALAAAYERSRAASSSVLQDLVPGLDLDDILQRSDGGVFLARQKPIDLGTVLDPIELLDRLTTRHDLSDGRLKFVRERDRADPGQAQDLSASGVGSPLMPASRLAAMLDEGHTVVVDGMDRRDATVRRLAEHVSRVYRAPVNVNAYISYRPHQSFGAHWDDHDVMILHLLGRKRWQVFEPVALSPKFPAVNEFEHGERLWEGVVEPGHFLYVPRGWGHDVTGLDQLTFHLTITVPRVVTSELVKAATLLPGAPLPSLDGVRPADGDPARLSELAGALMASTITDDRLDRTIAAFRANLLGCTQQRPSALRAALLGRIPREDLWVRSTAPGGAVRAVDASGASVLMWAQHAADVEPDALTVLAPLLDSRVHRAAAVEAAAAVPGLARAAIDAALAHGLLEVVDEPGAWGLVAGVG